MHEFQIPMPLKQLPHVQGVLRKDYYRYWCLNSFRLWNKKMQKLDNSFVLKIFLKYKKLTMVAPEGHLPPKFVPSPTGMI